MTTDTSSMRHVPEIFGELKANWGWLMAVGILFIVLGVIGLGMTTALTLASVLIFGVFMFIGGVVQLVDAFKCSGWKSVMWHVIIALLYISSGILIFNRPLLASTTLTAMLAFAIVAIGVFRIVIAIQMQGEQGRGWLFFAGIISVLLGILILARWPESSLWIIGLFIAIEMISHGWSYVMLAIAAKNAPNAKELASTA